MALSMDAVKDIGKNSARATLDDLRGFVQDQIADERLARQRYQEASYNALTLGKAEAAKTLSSIANDEAKHLGWLKDMETALASGTVGYTAPPSENGGGISKALDAKDLKDIADATADEVMERIYGMQEMLANIMEHEVMGGARVINEAKAKNLDIPCKCFKFEGEEFCWKPGYLGLISSKKNPEQLANCRIKVPASPGAQERFIKIKGAVVKATKEHETKGGGLPAYWTMVGEHLSQAGVTL